jgi:hypothetical protein
MSKFVRSLAAAVVGSAGLLAAERTRPRVGAGQTA